MRDMTDGVRTLLARELETFVAEIEMFPDDELMWRVLPGVTNSAANLALHVSGNLQHFIGAVLGKTGYVRDRTAEFGTRVGTRAEVVAQLRATKVVVDRVLSSVGPERVEGDWPEPIHGHVIPADRFLLHLVAHLAHHLGQAGYLRRVLTGDNRSSNPLPMGVLATGTT
jgi:hypothetical protein